MATERSYKVEPNTEYMVTHPAEGEVTIKTDDSGTFSTSKPEEQYAMEQLGMPQTKGESTAKGKEK